MPSLPSSASSNQVTTTIALTEVLAPGQGCHFTAASTWQVQFTTKTQQYAQPTIFATPRIDSKCYAEGYGTRGQVVLYSPGVCPSGYYAAIPSGMSGAVTSYCCPDGAAFPYVIGEPSYCYSTIKTNWAEYLGGGGSASSYQFGASQIIIQPGAGDPETVVIGIAQPLTVTWQSSDLTQFTPASAPINDVATSHFIGTFVSTEFSGAATASATESGYQSASSSSSPSSGLSTGAQAGIGVGVAVGALILLGGFLWWFLRHRKAKRRHVELPTSDPDDQQAVVAEKDGSVARRTELGDDSAVNEMDGRSHAAELHQYDKLAEMDSSARYELPAST